MKMGSPPRRPFSMADFTPPYTQDEVTAERRAVAQRRYEEFQAERQRQLAAQASPNHSPAERIRAWEQLHQLSLPKSSEHRLVNLIARQTGLGIAAVHAEQQRRASGL
jgi:hypothetical protein